MGRQMPPLGLVPAVEGSMGQRLHLGGGYATCSPPPLTGGCSTCSPDTPCPLQHPPPSATASSSAGGLPLSEGRSGSRPLGVGGVWGGHSLSLLGIGEGGDLAGLRTPTLGHQLPLLTLHELHDDVDRLLLGADANETHDVGVAVLLQDPGAGGCCCLGSCRRPEVGGRGSLTHSLPWPQEPHGSPGSPREEERKAAAEKSSASNPEASRPGSGTWWDPEPLPLPLWGALRIQGHHRSQALRESSIPSCPEKPFAWVLLSHDGSFITHLASCRNLALRSGGSVSRQDFTATRVLSARRRPLKTSPKFP